MTVANCPPAAELDGELQYEELLVSLMRGSSSSSSDAIVVQGALPTVPGSPQWSESGASDSTVDALPMLLSTPARPSAQPRSKRKIDEDDGVELDEKGLPIAIDEETRRQRKMARNRRAAADSRARKKEKTDTLEARVAELEAENARLRAQLARVEGAKQGAMSTRSEDERSDHATRRPISQQPEAFWTYSPKRNIQLPWLAWLVLSRMTSPCSKPPATCPSTMPRGGPAPWPTPSSSSAACASAAPSLRNAQRAVVLRRVLRTRRGPRDMSDRRHDAR